MKMPIPEHVWKKAQYCIRCSFHVQTYACPSNFVSPLMQLTGLSKCYKIIPLGSVHVHELRQVGAKNVYSKSSQICLPQRLCTSPKNGMPEIKTFPTLISHQKVTHDWTTTTHLAQTATKWRKALQTCLPRQKQTMLQCNRFGAEAFNFAANDLSQKPCIQLPELTPCKVI